MQKFNRLRVRHPSSPRRYHQPTARGHLAGEGFLERPEVRFTAPREYLRDGRVLAVLDLGVEVNEGTIEKSRSPTAHGRLPNSGKSDEDEIGKRIQLIQRIRSVHD